MKSRFRSRSTRQPAKDARWVVACLEYGSSLGEARLLATGMQNYGRVRFSQSPSQMDPPVPLQRQ